MRATNLAPYNLHVADLYTEFVLSLFVCQCCTAGLFTAKSVSLNGLLLSLFMAEFLRYMCFYVAVKMATASTILGASGAQREGPEIQVQPSCKKTRREGIIGVHEGQEDNVGIYVVDDRVRHAIQAVYWNVHYQQLERCHSCVQWSPPGVCGQGYHFCSLWGARMVQRSRQELLSEAMVCLIFPLTVSWFGAD